MNDDDDINNYVPSLLNPRAIKKPHNNLSLTQASIVSRRSLSLKRNAFGLKPKPFKVTPSNIENSINVCNVPKLNIPTKDKNLNIHETESLGFSAIDDLVTNKGTSLSLDDFDNVLDTVKKEPSVLQPYTFPINTSPDYNKVKDESTSIHKRKPLISISFGVNNCENVQVTSDSSAIKRFHISHKDNSTNIDCDLIEGSDISTVEEVDENMNKTFSSPKKRSAIDVNIEIKKQKLSNGNEKVLILNTNAIEKISHVIIQPPNYKFVKRNFNRNKINQYLNGNGVKLKQISIDSFFPCKSDVNVGLEKNIGCVNNEGEMSKNLGVNDSLKCDRVGRSVQTIKDVSPKSAKISKRDLSTPKRPDVKICNSDAPSPRRNDSSSAQSVRKIDAMQFNLPTRPKTNKPPISPKNIPDHKIVAGTHFAVDAFSYGDIPNVKHYFLTHFHSDHYSGLKKGFNKILFCSKITADLCISRLGVNPKYIHVINIDETLRIDGVEVTAVDANHCPGAIMLVFTLPNGKTLLHTGDFRACPAMESYPIFWNKDIHTIYLDTTYCNPRYDFPTQDQSLEMALYVLRQKKMALEKAGKKFSSVLIVCGTYSIGKEKFFLGMSRRVGCSVWACPEKERVLAALHATDGPERRPPQQCQLHVVPMRDLTHETLRSYLDSLGGAFSEVVAFKPSGWENGKNSVVEKDNVTIHGIPYSEHSSFSELVRFVKFLKPKQVIPTVDITGGVKAVQKYFPCPLVCKDEVNCQSKLTDYFSIQSRQQVPAVT